MNEQLSYDVFLSHSSRDKAVVRAVAERLRQDGLKVWFDEWVLKPGDSIPAKIEEGLEHSRVLVLCMSANAFGSDWAQLEAGTFRFRDPLNKERRFIPLRLDDAPIKGSLAQFLYINWRSADREQEYARLLEACRHPETWPLSDDPLPAYFCEMAKQQDDDSRRATQHISISMSDISSSEVNIAGRDLIQTRISYEFKSPDSAPVRIQSLLSVLREGENLEASFLRLAGATWSDFENGFHPFSPDDAAPLVESLEKQRFHLLEGTSIGWRENFARYVGWTLSKRGKKVLFTDCWTWPANPVFPIDWPAIDNSETFLIVENAHVKPSDVEEFFAQVQDRSKQLRLIISSDPVLYSLIIRRPYFQSPILELARTTIRGGQFSEKLIDRYAEKVTRRQVGSRTRMSFSLESFEGFPGIFFRSDERSEANLWLLAALLSAWDGKEPIGKERGQEALQSFVAENIFQAVRLKSPAHGSLAATVALFSYYCVSLPETFLTKDLHFEQAQIDDLLKAGILQSSELGVSLQDYRLAALLIRSVKEGSETQNELKARFGTPRPAPEIVRRAFVSGIPDCDVLLLNLHEFPDLGVFNPLRIFPSEIEDEVLEAALEKHLRHDSRPGHVGRFLAAAARANLHLSELKDILPVSRCKSLIESKDATAKEIAWLVLGIHEMDAAMSQEFVRSISLDVLIQKVKEERHIGKVGSLLWAVNGSDHETGSHLARLLEKSGLGERLNAEPEIARVGWVFEVITPADSETAATLAAQLDIIGLGSRITSKTSNCDLSALLWGLSRCSPESASAIADVVSDNNLRSRVESESDAWNLGLLLRALGEANPERSRRFIGGIQPQFFQKIAEAEEDVKKLGMLFSGLKTAHPEYAAPLISNTISHLSFEAASQWSAYRMFSNMNPTAMAEAGRKAQRAEERAKAISSFSSFYPSARFLEAGMNLSPTKKPLQRSKSEWTQYSPSEVIWRAYVYEPEYCSTLLQNQTWESVARRCEREDSFTQKCKLAIALQSANPARFRTWLSSLAKTPLSELHLKDLTEGLFSSASHNSVAGFLLYLTATVRDTPSVDRLLTGASVDQVNTLLGLLDYFDARLARELLTQVSASMVRAFVKAGSEWDLETFAGLVYEIAPEQAGRIPEGSFQVYENRNKRPVLSVRGDLPAISEVLSRLNSHSLFDRIPRRKFDARHRLRFARALEAMGTVSAMQAHADLGEVGRCIDSITERDRETGRAIVASLDAEILRQKIRKSKEPSPRLFSAIVKANHDVAERLTDAIVAKVVEIGSTVSIAIIEEVWKGDEQLGRKLLSQINTQEIATWCSQGRDVEDVAKAFASVVKLDASRRKGLFDSSTIGKLKKMIAKADHLWTLIRSLNHFADADVEIAKILAKHISTKALEGTLETSDLGLITNDSYDRNGIVNLAILNPERLMGCREIFLRKIYTLDPNEYSAYESAEKLFQQLREKCPQVWRHLVGGLDVSKLAALVSREGAKKESWHTPDFSGLFEELYRADKQLAKQLQERCSKRIPAKWLEDLAMDYP